MFGTLRPQLCRLERNESQAYRRMYCGTCKALGDGYGLLARPLLSYDAVLLSTVIEALCDAPSPTGSCRCPLMPLAHRAILTPDSPAMRVSAAVQILLTDQWLADHEQEGHDSAHPARLLLRSRAARARQGLGDLGLDTCALDTLAERQAQAEREIGDIASAAEPTAAALASIFGQLGRLPGAIAAVAPGTEHARTLQALGYHLGLSIYALDALEDLEKDLANGAFNPCIDDRGLPSPPRVAAVATALTDALAAIADAVARLPWQRHATVLRNILCGRFRDRAMAAIDSATALIDRYAVAPPRRSTWPVRAFLATWGVLASLWAFAVRQARTSWRRARHRRPQRVEPSCAPPLALATAGGTASFAMASNHAGTGSSSPSGAGAGDQSGAAEDDRKRRCCDCCDCCNCCDCDGCSTCCGDGATCGEGSCGACGDGCQCCECGDCGGCCDCS